MKKSTLGRRSHIPVRVPSSGGSASRSCTEKKSTGALLKPGHTQRNRSQSADREGCVSHRGLQFQRANTIPAMLQHTSVQGNLPTGSARAPKSQMVSTDSARRMTGFGGGGKRKDTRPIAEKPFQQAAQAKVQEYFDRKASDVIGPGNSIRPMNTKMFLNIMNHLLQNLDSKILIGLSNYLEEIPKILKNLGYMSKVEKSWLITVNTPHSWQHVIAVLCWLVDLKEVMDLTDPFEMMYTVEDNGEKEVEKEDEIAIDKDMVLHLKRTYLMRKSDKDQLAVMDEEFIEKQIIDLKCTEEDFDTLQRQLDLIKEEVESGNQRKALVIDELQKIKEKEKAVIEDSESMKEFIELSKAYVERIEVKLATTDKEITVKRAALEKKKEELQKIQDKVNTQQMSRDEIDQLNVEKNNLQRMVKFYTNSIREYQNSIFAVDMKLAEDQKRLDKLVLEFNKLVAETIALEPKLKNCEINSPLLTDGTMMEAIDSRLKILKDTYKSTIKNLHSQKENSETTLKLTTEEINKTIEDINREIRLLEKFELGHAEIEDSSLKSQKSSPPSSPKPSSTFFPTPSTSFSASLPEGAASLEDHPPHKEPKEEKKVGKKKEKKTNIKEKCKNCVTTIPTRSRTRWLYQDADGEFCLEENSLDGVTYKVCRKCNANIRRRLNQIQGSSSSLSEDEEAHHGEQVQN